ncbi:uncharacterized protein I206_106219 [Kwoniella pini CBS 10737]|uniref:Uncharacterized protein n=1 Tax=Kwoniella pini CBS 10737 TaxID=1296096 RepID=A0A1B9I1D4_9TREE|nr:uncharacterized protein I206_05045 [Kwoniella pini CBS 10737]OCF49352.1 hypothetical protein I206_05045 [Kwoniella pini CBS 10737]
MSTTAIRMTTHAPSPSYVPRSTLGSRPNSPALPPKPQAATYSNHGRSSSTSRLDTSLKASTMSPSIGGGAAPTPRLGPIERSVSGLRNEVKDESRKEQKSEAARAILKMLSSLPAPLPEKLPPTFLPTPSTSPISLAGSPTRTFTDYARSSLKRNKRKRATDSSSSSSDSSTDIPSSGFTGNHANGNIGLGLGLGLSMSSPEQARKKPRLENDKPDTVRRSSAINQNGRSLTPAGSGQSSSIPTTSSKKPGTSNLRNEVTEEESKENWSKEKWRSTAIMYRERALLMKRHGDAYQRVSTAQPKYVSQLPKDPLKGCLSLTDAVLLWLYSYFCDEQDRGRVRATPYNESAPLREYVKKAWENEMRNALEEEEDRREMAQGMVGLMYLIEAVIGYHLTSEQFIHLNQRGKELQNSIQINVQHQQQQQQTSSSYKSSNSSPPNNSNFVQIQNNISPSSNNNQHSPESNISCNSSSSSSSTINTNYNLPPDLLPLINSSTNSSFKSQQNLLNSRNYLTILILSKRFPKTFNFALNSSSSFNNNNKLKIINLNDNNKINNNNLNLNIDKNPENFNWPIELGMSEPILNIVAFGRCLIEEMANHFKKDWIRIVIE